MSTASESHSPARGNGLTQVLSKARRGRNKKPTDNNSLASNGSDGSHGLRGKLEGVIDKLKNQDGSDDDNGDSGGLSKLIPKGIGSKRRRKKEERDAEQLASEQAARGRSVAERGTLDNGNGEISVTADGDGSSLITYESENEDYTPIPPPLSSHPSHSGYLTTSSPLINASTLREGTQSELQLDGTSRATTFPVLSTPSNASQPSQAINTASLQKPSDDSTRRSTSPVGKLREAFSSPRRGPSTSPERKSTNGGGTVITVQKEENTGNGGRRGSVASRIGAIFPGKETILPSNFTSPERPRSAKVPRQLEIDARPQTPPTGDNPAPLIVNTPPTPTDHGSFAAEHERSSSEPPAPAPASVVVSPSGNMISHRRVRSGTATLGPSKLSNITSAPLTPTLENPVASLGQNQGGFFSSVFSAAQNAANTLSNSIANTSLAPGQNKSKSVPQELRGIDDVEVETVGEKTEPGDESEQKEPAVKTLGMGDLSLSHLGISEPNSIGNTPTTSKFPEIQVQRGRSDSMNNRDEPFPNKPVTALIGESTETGQITSADDVQSSVRPRSVYESKLGGDQTPPNGSLSDIKSGITRSGSIRSFRGEGSRRHRGSSATTGTTIAAAIMAANASVAHPAARESTPKLTGFAVASKKRNRDFHQYFRSVPDDDYLIEDYSCALQREILAHGRLYVSEGHLCFSSNIFGWVTTLVMSFDEIVSVEKRSTALVFKNGLMISTLHAKHIFASFTSRDSTYDLIVGIWKLGHPSLRSSLNGVRIEETGGGDKTEKDDGNGSQSGSGSEDETEDGDVYDEDDEEEDGMSFTQAGEGSISGSDVADKAASRKPSAAVPALNGTTAEKSKETSPLSATDFPGPAAHAPTECADQETHYDKILADEIIPAPLGKTYDLMFGPASVSWMAKWLTNEQKCQQFTMEDEKGLSNDNRVRMSSYIKPLGGAIGPKQTKCIVTENLDSMDLEKAVSVTLSTQTPDVPSGNVFVTKTKYCLMWAEGNSTRLLINFTIEWSGKSWLKGPIEKGANDGQIQYARDIIASLKATLSSRRPTTTTGGKPKKKGRKEKARSAPGDTDGASDPKGPSAKEDWGLLESLHGPLGPVVDILKPLLSGNMVYGLLVGLLVAAWFSFGYSRGSGSSKDISFFINTPERIAAYEEMWRHEESELWAWLEERVGMDRVHHLSSKSDQAKSIEEKIREERISEREVDTAIRVTEEKLEALKAMVEKQKAGRGKADAGMKAATKGRPVDTPLPMKMNANEHGNGNHNQDGGAADAEI